MKNKITISTIVIFLFYSFASLSQTIKWEDRMNGDNSVAGLQAREWIILNEDGGGFTDPWFQGTTTVFGTYEGPDTGYVASNYLGANVNDVLDQWLISPAITVVPGDSLSFWARSPDQSAFDDSIDLLISPTAGITPSAFGSFGRYLVSKNGWQGFYVLFNLNATIRFAIRYYLFDAQTNANYIGLDLFQLFTSSISQSITVTAPVAGANWTIGTSYEVTWTSTGVTGNVNLKLSIDGGGTYPIILAANTANDGTENIIAPNNLSTTCRVKIESVNNSSIFGVNPGNFAISASQSITVTAPVAGANWTVGTTYEVTWTSTGITGNVNLKLSTDGGSTYPIMLTSNTANDGTENIIAPNNLSTTCRVKVESVNNSSIFGVNPGNFTISIVNPPTIPINESFEFINVTSSSSYKMIGLPGDNSIPITGLNINGTQKVDWNVFYDNGATTDYLVEYNGTNISTFNFKPGNGFWLLSKNTISINAQVNSVTLTGGNYSIPLHSGWNIISNPFERSTNWLAVQTANGLAGNTVIHDWGGVWTNPATFFPYKAYYFNNVTGLPSLKIPYDPGGTLGKTSGENILQISGENDIKISLLSNGEEKSKVFIGFNAESTNDFDKADYFAPPGDFEEVRIVIRNGNLSTNYKFLMKETRREIGEGQIYNLEVKNLTGQDLILKSEGIANHQNYLFYLIDERLNNAIKLSEDLKIKIAANVKNNNYRLLIGTQQFIDANKENLAPTAFALYQNYPNPFNPTTVIRYSVPQSSLVSIKLFDILGNEVMTLLNEVKSPGNYEVEFSAKSGSASGGNGFSLASGVYIYKFQAGPITQSKKMILLR